MEKLRRKRYNDKIKFIKESLNYFNKFGDNELSNRGILYSIQVAIESTVDLVAMLVKDLNMIVLDDKSNIEKLVKHMNWDIEFAENLIKANGLRNIIVHQYNGIQKEKISESISRLKSDINNWIQLIEETVAKIDDK
ncbi:MAG: DUF86 domain-containing protein [Promethearchaeota archaeon]